MIALFGCSLDPKVRYEVSGSATSADAKYYNHTGGLEMQNGASVPWSHSFTGRNGTMAMLSASSRTGTVTVTIYVNGYVYKTSMGPGFAVVSGAL